MKFQQLIQAINQVHNNLQRSAVKAVNRHFTILNWLIGYYIEIFEHKDEDRAAYSSKLLEKLLKRLLLKDYLLRSYKDSAVL
jgi:hypothetical protein